MAKLAAKFTKLKKQVGGNREKVKFEFTYGMPMEEKAYITPVNKWNRRILGEIEFAIRLSDVCNAAYDSCIEQALDFLQDCMDEEGVLTKANCLKAEEMLSECTSAAKEYEVILAAHAHIDMNWLWGWQETVAITLSTFKTMLMLMDQYPKFCFSQSQASVYAIVEKYDPELMTRIQEKIREGRWEVTATAWVETDKNMPNTESLLNHIKYTRDYLQEHWNIDPDSLEIDFSPDTFGHSTNLPEIDSYGSIKYYYLCRGGESDDVLFRWKSPSGKELLVYREQYWYNSSITPFCGVGAVELSKQCAGLKTGLVVYGVGDHGGGPSRRDIERAMEMNKWPIFPKLTFGCVKDFFKKAESVRELLPLKEGELNFVAPGCYTTQSRIKLGNRRCEAALYDAQFFSALSAKNFDSTYHYEQFTSAWKNVLFTHFHDILTGSCVQDSREHAMGLYSDSMAIANTQYSNAMQVISENIDTSFAKDYEDISGSLSEGAGVGYGLSYYGGVPNPERGAGKTRIYHVFNPSAHQREEIVELTVWDWTGDLRYIKVEDVNRNDIPCQLIDLEQQFYWDHIYVRVLVKVTVPAGGYQTVVLLEAEPDEYRIYHQKDAYRDPPARNFILENEHIRAEFDYLNGEMLSLTDLHTNEQMIQEGMTAGLRCIAVERNSSSAWAIGKYTDNNKKIQLTAIYPFNDGTLRKGFRAEYKLLNSTIKATVSLDANGKAVKHEWQIDWHEESFVSGHVPVLIYHMPVSYNVGHYQYDIPGGAQCRKEILLDVPGLQYGAAINEIGSSAAIITNCKYGYRGANNAIGCTLIHTAPNPDPYPERGIHKITLFAATGDCSPTSMAKLAFDLNHPMSAQTANIHDGSLPAEASLFEFESKTAVLSSVTMSKEGKLLIRLYEISGEESLVTIRMRTPIKCAQAINLMGISSDTKIKVNGCELTFAAQPYCIQGILIG